MLSSISIIVVGVIVLFVTITALISRYKRCPSDKILVVYGRTGGASAKCIHGGGAFIWPVIQDFAYLDDIKLKKKTDFEDNLENLKKATDYLFNSELNDNDIDRLYCQKFIIIFAEKTPITITLDASIVDISKKNESLLAMYIGGLLVSKMENEAAES